MKKRTESKVRIDGGVAYIELSRGQEALIDVADVDLVAGRTWFAQWNSSIKGYYAVARLRVGEEGKRSAPLYMHRHIMGAKKGEVVDHIHHNTLDNRRSELKLCSNQENNQNRKGVDPRSKTGIRGVSIHTNPDGRQYYVARITVVQYFPFTDEGLALAAAKAEELRAAIPTGPGH